MPVIAINTNEEERAVAAICALARDITQRNLEARRSPAHVNVCTWNMARGLTCLAGSLHPDTGQPLPQDLALPEVHLSDTGNTLYTTNILDTLTYIGALSHPSKALRTLFILADVDACLSPGSGQFQHDVIRAFRNMCIGLRGTLSHILCIGPDWPQLPTLKDDVLVVDMPLPNRTEMTASALAFANSIDIFGVTVDKDEETVYAIVTALLGLSEQEANRALRIALRSTKSFGLACIPVILKAKAAMIQASGCLEYLTPRPLTDAGGYGNVLRTLERAKRSRERRNLERGAAMKGCLFTGIPGTGKGWWATIAPTILDLPAVRLDMGSAMGSLVGESERRIDQALKIVHAMGGILVIDEFEKATGGVRSSAQTDGGTTSRVIGKLLTWMAEQENVYVIACANDVTKLDPEQLRGGRFDAKLFFDLPTTSDLSAVLAVHLQKRSVNQDGIDIPLVVGALHQKGFVPAEVEVMVKEAILDADERGDAHPTTIDLLNEIERYTTLATMNASTISQQREWAKRHNLTSASAVEYTVPFPVTAIGTPSVDLN